ncbi:MAG: hypothetical protein QNJ69_03570 [Gammaproteobacteria bacterium]|nr:hypothetical protein [Gammaproteobacteria bacterium]
MASSSSNRYGEVIQFNDLVGAISQQASALDGNPLLVAICGAADLGKSQLSRQLVSALVKSGLNASHITLDSYLMDRSKRNDLDISGYQPEAYDLAKIKSNLYGFLQGTPIECFPYDHAEGKTLPSKITINPCHILFLDGLHSMHQSLKPYISYSIFMHTNDNLLLKIRHKADIEKRKQSVEYSNLKLRDELTAYKLYVEPYMKSADVILEVNEQWQYEIRLTTVQT